MEILVQTDSALVIHGDWRDVLPALGDGAADVTITDPPYSDHVHQNVRSCNTTGKVKVKKYDIPFDALTDFDHVEAALAASRRWVLMCCALESFGEYLEAAGGHWKKKGHYVRSGIWRKKQAAPQLSGDRPANSCEGVAIMHPRLPKGERLQWNGRGGHAYWVVDGDDTGGDWVYDPDARYNTWIRKGQHPATETTDVPCFFEHGRERAEKRHPAQKPGSFVEELVVRFSNPGETVLDLFAGSGSLAKVALPLGRKVILIEKDPEWAEECARVCLEWELSSA